MCLDAAVMGTCPTFINQSWKKKRKQREGRGGRSGERRCRVNRRGREKEIFSRKEGGGLNKAHIDVPNTAAGVS